MKLLEIRLARFRQRFEIDHDARLVFRVGEFFELRSPGARAPPGSPASAAFPAGTSPSLPS